MASFFKKKSNNHPAIELPMVGWINTARIVALLIIIGGLIFRWNLNLFHYDSQALFYVFFFYLLTSILFVALPKKVKSQEKWKKLVVYAELLTDVFFITLIVHFTGGMQSRLAFLYIIPVLSSSLISSWVAIITGIITLLVYYGLIYFEHIGLIKTIGTSISINSYFSQLQLIRQTLVILIVAFGGAYYFHSIKSLNNKILALKDEFLFRTVHDIRSPATAIRWLLEKYQNKEFRERYPEIQKDIEEIENLLARIHKLSENILTLAKDEKIETPKELIALPAVVQSTLKEMQPDIVKKNIVLKYSAPPDLPMVLANFDLLQEVFANIIGNAVKYNKLGGELEIQHRIESNILQTTVANTGPPVAPENIKKLFTPYFRGGEELTTKGTGLGLYISKKIVEKMGGSIGVKSSSGEKTVFYISLPLTEAKS